MKIRLLKKLRKEAYKNFNKFYNTSNVLYYTTEFEQYNESFVSSSKLYNNNYHAFIRECILTICKNLKIKI